MDEIIKLILLRNKERRILNNNDIKFISFYLINKYKYKDLVDTIKFKNVSKDDENTAAYYDGDTIVFFRDGLEKDAIENYNELRDNFTFDGTKVDFYNFVTLSTIFHEFTHVYQRRIINSKVNSTENKIISFCAGLEKINEFYEKNYDIDLKEVQAFSEGYVKALHIYEHLTKDFVTENDKRTLTRIVLDNILHCYLVDNHKDKIISPSERLIKVAACYPLNYYNLDISKFMKSILNNNLSLYKKLQLGLPISYDEYAYMNLKADCIESGNNIRLHKILSKK